MNQAEPFTFKGHSHIRVRGDALTPARMWQVTLCTEQELKQMDDDTRAEFRAATTHDAKLIHMHFGRG